MGVLPSDEHGETDFVLTTRPEETTAYLALGVSFHGMPTARLRIESVDGGFTLEQLGIGLTELLRSQSEGRLPVGGLVLACETQRVVGDVCPLAARRTGAWCAGTVLTGRARPLPGSGCWATQAG